MWFFETPPGFHWFFANVNARSPLAGIIQVFGHRGTWSSGITRGPRCTAHYVQSKVERSHACTPLTKKKQYEILGFLRMRFSCPPTKKKSYGFFWQCKRYNKTPRFLDFVFVLNVNGPTNAAPICIQVGGGGGQTRSWNVCVGHTL